MGISERKEREKEQRRNDIIDAAEKIFFKKGLNNSTMDEVAEEAEFSKGTLYLYFKSKEEIHFEIKTRAINILMKMFKDSISANKNGFENCMEIGKAYVDFVNKHRNYYKAIFFLKYFFINLKKKNSQKLFLKTKKSRKKEAKQQAKQERILNKKQERVLFLQKM